MGLRRYLDVLRAPGVAPLVAALSLGRLPYGMNVLALILLLRAEGYSYAEAGLVSGAAALAIAAGAPLLGRLVDRVGQTRVLVACAVVCPGADVALALAALGHADASVLVALALVAGAATPSLGPVMRALWPSLVGPDRLDTAFAFDALQIELVFIAGPLLAATLAAAVSPAFAFLVGVALQATGALAFAATGASRRWRPEREAARTRGGALAAPGMRVLVASLAVTALNLGVLEIAITAFAERESSRSDAGWLFALWAAGSLAGGLWYGARTWHAPAASRFLGVGAALTIGLAPLPLAGSLGAFAVLVVIAGLALAPATAAAYALVDTLAPPGARTEAYAWQIVAYVAGSAVGAWLAGTVVEEVGVTGALACAPLAAALGLAVAVVGKSRITAPPELGSPGVVARG